MPATATTAAVTLPAPIDRHEWRRQIRQRIAAYERREVRRRELRDAIAAIDADLDAEVNKHGEACKPIQDELQAIETAEVARIADRLPADPKVEARRRALLDQLAELNNGLEAAVDASSQRKRPLGRELSDLKKNEDVVIDVLHAKLADELADPSIRLEAFAAKQRRLWLDARLKGAYEGYARVKVTIKTATQNRDPIVLAAATHRLDCWQSEITTCSAELAQATSDIEEIRQRAIAE